MKIFFIFWTLGAGGGNFGVVTSFVLQTHRPRSPNMLVGEYCWEPFDPVIEELWTFWLEQWDKWPDWMDIEPAWLLIAPESVAAETVRASRQANGSSENNDPRMFCFTVVCNGDPDTECAPYVNPIAAKYPPVINSVLPQPFMQQLANVDVTDAQEGFLYLTSGILPPGALTTEVIAQLVDALENAPSDRNLVLFHAGGGQISQVTPTSTAFVHRDLELVIQIKGIWEDAADEEENIAWVKSTRALVEPLLSGSYINYIDPLLADWQDAYYGENYARLLDIKHALDPDNFFRFNQSVGSF
jgi:FAD/FMN-containing dehydrogenase